MSQVTVLTGAIWGIAGAIAMVVVVRIGGRSAPSFAAFWSRFVGGGDASDAMVQALLFHAVYAVVAGGAYAVISGRFDLGYPITGYAGGTVWGIVRGLVLIIVAAVFWANMILDMDPDRRQVLTRGVAHVASGLVLGILGVAVPHLI